MSAAAGFVKGLQLPAQTAGPPRCANARECKIQGSHWPTTFDLLPLPGKKTQTGCVAHGRYCLLARQDDVEVPLHGLPRFGGQCPLF